MKACIFRVCVPTLLAFLAGACTPTRSSIKPPYVLDGKSYSEPELQQFALDRCVAAQPGAAPPPHLFTTDGCSVWRDSTWRACCIDHDVKYWCGADVRKKADQDLRSCVRAHGSATNAALMYGGVRIGGARWWPFPWGWGYGYKWPHPAK